MAHGSGVHVGGAPGLGDAARASRWPAAGRPGGSATGSVTRSRATAPTPSGSPTASATGRSRSAALLYTAGYVVVAAVTGALASTAATAPDTSRVVLWSFLLCGGARRTRDRDRLRPRRDLDRNAPGVRRRRRRPRAAGCVRLWLVVALVAFLVALVTDFDTALNVTSQLHTDTGATVPAGRRLAAGGPQRRGLLRLLPARPRLHRRHQHDRRLRPWSRSARCRCSRCWPRCPTPGRRRAGQPPSSGCRRSLRRSARCARSAAPDVPLGGRRPARLRRWDARRRCCSASSRCWPAVRSGPGRMTRRRSARRRRCWCTRSPRSASAACLGGLGR